MLNVLSIDWDYFVDADAIERSKRFPDIPNEKYLPVLQDTIWTSRYAEDDSLLNIGVKPVAYSVADALEEMEDIPLVVVCDSHKWAYTFTVQRLQETGNKQINLLNLDFHHDCRGDIKELDCGNWVSVLMSEYRGKWRWVGWKDSYKTGKPRNLKFLTGFDMSMIMDIQWDLVFICRSNMWSPPHLDDVFTDVFQPVTDRRYCHIQKGIWDSRYERLTENINGLKQALADWKKQNSIK